MLFDPSAPLTPTGNLRRRQIVSRLAESGAVGASLLALAVLAIVIFAVASRGASALSWDFLTKSPPLFGGPGGGIAPAIVGTAVIAAMATAIAMPVGVLVALYLTEFAGRRSSRWIRLTLDVMNGLPTVVVGLFVFGLMVSGHKQTGFAGSVALAIIMLPLIARSTQEVLLLVPRRAARGGGRARGEPLADHHRRDPAHSDGRDPHGHGSRGGPRRRRDRPAAAAQRPSPPTRRA